jgi:hypothetical protein
LAIKHFLLSGKDGYTSILDPSVQILTDLDEAPTIQDIVKFWFHTFGKSEKEISKMPEKALRIFERRLKMLNTSVDNRCPSGKFIKISPTIEGRIINIGNPAEHND